MSTSGNCRVDSGGSGIIDAINRLEDVKMDIYVGPAPSAYDLNAIGKIFKRK